MAKKKPQKTVTSSEPSKNASLIAEIKLARDEAESAWRPYMSEAHEDEEFYMSKQWDEKVKKELDDKGIPTLNINYTKKTIDMITGYQRQNKVDLRARPIESSDEVNAEVKSRLLKWITSNSKYDMAQASVFKDEVISGLGWFEIGMNYDRDILNGDIEIRHEQFFSMKVDPHSVELDLSDADYIIREKLITRKKAMHMYPNQKEKIKKAPTQKQVNDGYRRDPYVPMDAGKKINVLEYWRREYISKTFIVNTEDIADSIEFDGPKEELDVLLRENETLRPVRKEVPVIKLTILVGENIIVYDGDHPEGLARYPFIPSFGFFVPSYDRIELKVQGVMRSLKDPQREKNVRRSQLLRSVGNSMRTGYIYEEGAIDDVEELRESAGYDAMIQVRPTKLSAIRQQTPPPIDSAVVQLETMFEKDIQHIGANPDMLGQITERGASGVTVNLRLKQGLMTIQEIFDNHFFALQKVGEYIIALMDKNFSQPKIERILGDDIPFNKQRKELQEKVIQLQDQNQDSEQQAKALQEQEQKQVQTHKAMNSKALKDYSEADDKDVADGIYRASEGVEEQAQIEREASQQQRALLQQQQQQIGIALQECQKAFAEVDRKEKEFWENYNKSVGTARYDIAIDQAVSSPTYRHSIQQLLLQSAQYGIPVLPESIIEYSDLPEKEKEKMKAKLQQQAIQQQQFAEAQSNSQQAKNLNRTADAQSKAQ